MAVKATSSTKAGASVSASTTTSSNETKKPDEIIKSGKPADIKKSANCTNYDPATQGFLFPKKDKESLFVIRHWGVTVREYWFQVLYFDYYLKNPYLYGAFI